MGGTEENKTATQKKGKEKRTEGRGIRWKEGRKEDGRKDGRKATSS
jgi:hypothetical protein